MRKFLVFFIILLVSCKTRQKVYRFDNKDNLISLNQNDSTFVRIKLKYKGYNISKLNAVYLTDQKIFIKDSLLLKKYVNLIMVKHYNKFINKDSAKLRFIIGDNSGLANGYIAYKMGEYPNYFISKLGTNIIVYATRNYHKHDGVGWDKFDPAL